MVEWVTLMLNYFWTSHHIKCWSGIMLNTAKSVDLRSPVLASLKTPLLVVLYIHNFLKTGRKPESSNCLLVCMKPVRRDRTRGTNMQVSSRYWHTTRHHYSTGFCLVICLCFHMHKQWTTQAICSWVSCSSTITSGQEDLNFQPYNCQGHPIY